MLALRARYVFPIASPPLPDGVITIDGERIIAVGENLSGKAPRDLGGVALLPGFVNAHTHLEFSDLAAPLGVAGESMPAWIRRVIAHRIRRDPQAVGPAILRGLQESLAAGVTTIGEISTGGWPPADQVAADVTIFQEAIGLASEKVNEHVAKAEEHVRQIARQWRQSNVQPGLSPHAPYSVHAELVRQFCRLSKGLDVPVAMHVAESREELELLASRRGPMRQLLDELGVWRDDAIEARRPLELLQTLATAARALVIHGNYLTSAEIEFLAQRSERMSVVYCPRTHAFFQHAEYPLAQMLAASVAVALGTDSKASNPDLNLLAEMRRVAEHHPQVSPRQILELGTLGGARALGAADSVGSLEAGKFANFAVIALPEAKAADPHELLFVERMPARGTWWHGREINTVGATA